MRNILDSADANGGFELVAGCDVYEPRREAIRTRSADVARVHSPLAITNTSMGGGVGIDSSILNENGHACGIVDSFVRQNRP